MKKNTCLALICLLVNLYAFSQKTYWQIDENVFESRLGKPGISVSIGNFDTLLIYTSSSAKLEPALQIEQTLTSFFKDLDLIKDSIFPTTSYNFNYTSLSATENYLNISRNAASNSRIFVGNKKVYHVKEPGDEVSIRYYTNNRQLASTLVFKVNNYEKLRNIGSEINLKDSIQVILNEIKTYESSKKYPKSRTEYSIDTYYFTERNNKKNNGGKRMIEPYHKNGNFVQPSVSASLHNYKNYFAPSFTAYIDVHATNLLNKQHATFSAFWQPVFVFNKNVNGNLKTYINHFVGIGFENSGATSKGLSIYVPFSISYLVGRSGEFFDKNTFNLGVGGVKYGALTVKPSMYFNNLFKKVSPSIQLSIGIGR